MKPVVLLIPSLLLAAAGVVFVACQPKPKPPAVVSDTSTVHGDSNPPCFSSDAACWDSVQAANTPTDTSAKLRGGGQRALTSMSLGPVSLSAADTLVRYVIFVLNKPPRSQDSVRIVWTRDTAYGNAKLTTTQWSKGKQRDSLTYRTPKVYGKKAAYSVCGNVHTGGVNIPGPACLTWATNYPVPPDTVPPVIDTIKVDTTAKLSKLIPKITLPTFTLAQWHAKGIWYIDTAQATLGTLRDSAMKVLPFRCPSSNCPSAPIQYCIFVQFVNGKVAYRSRDKDSYCDGEYAKFTSTQRAVTQAQQQVANGVCVKFHVDNLSKDTIQSGRLTIPDESCLSGAQTIG